MTAIIEKLRNDRERILSIANKYGADNIRVFGSVVRGEETDASDIDLLVDLDKDRSLFDLIGLKLELEELTGQTFDVVTQKALHRLIADQILKEAVRL